MSATTRARLRSNMLNFSIEYLTGNYTPYLSSDVDVDNDGLRQRSIGYSVFSRSSKSPDSGVSDNNLESPDAIADVLMSLEKQVSNVDTDNTGKQSPSTSPNQERQKPPHSYIALISMAILSSPDKRMLLGDIYQYIMDNFSYYNNKVKAWRNSIRHNLSLNECFVKNGRADKGKGNYWSIHPACLADFATGDFRRRQARRRARKTTKDTKTTQLPVGFGYNTGYVQMTSSSVGYHRYKAPVPDIVWNPGNQTSMNNSPQGLPPWTFTSSRYLPLADIYQNNPVMQSHPFFPYSNIGPFAVL